MSACDVRVRDAHVRVRRLWAVAVLLVVTAGIYYVFWYYRINRELRDYGRSFGDPNQLGVDLVRTMLAVTIGSLVIVPAAISVARTFDRIVHAERLSGATRVLSSRVGLALFVLALVLGAASLLPVTQAAKLALSLAALALLAGKLAYTQQHVNAIWLRELPN